MAKLRRFTGLVTNADPHDLEAGAATVQENCLARKAGSLSIRRGVRPVLFDQTGVSQRTGDVVALGTFRRGANYYVIYQDAGGYIRYGKNPI